MDFVDTPAEAAFRTEVRAWLGEHLRGEFAALGPGNGPSDETGWEVRVEWEKLLGADRWVAYAVAAAFGGGYWHSDRVFRRTIAELGRHNKALEELIDPNRTSSTLEAGTPRRDDRE